MSYSLYISRTEVSKCSINVLWVELNCGSQLHSGRAMGIGWSFQRLCFCFNRKQRLALAGSAGSTCTPLLNEICCSAVQRISCHTALGDRPRLLIALLRIPAVCVYASSSPWFMVRPSFSSEPGRAFCVSAFLLGLGLGSGNGLCCSCHV